MCKCIVQLRCIHEGESPTFSSPPVILVLLRHLHALQLSSHGRTGAIIVFSRVSWKHSHGVLTTPLTSCPREWIKAGRNASSVCFGLKGPKSQTSSSSRMAVDTVLHTKTAFCQHSNVGGSEDPSAWLSEPLPWISSEQNWKWPFQPAIEAQFVKKGRSRRSVTLWSVGERWARTIVQHSS